MLFDSCILEMDNEGVSEENYSSGEYWNKMRKCSVVREFTTLHKIIFPLKGKLPIQFCEHQTSYVVNFETAVLSDGIVKAVSACATKFCIAFNEPPVPTPKVCKTIRNN